MEPGICVVFKINWRYVSSDKAHPKDFGHAS